MVLDPTSIVGEPDTVSDRPGGLSLSNPSRVAFCWTCVRISIR